MLFQIRPLFDNVLIASFTIRHLNDFIREHFVQAVERFGCMRSIRMQTQVLDQR